MAFIARVEKPCTHCNVVIPKGTASGFTWDRTKGGFIHTDCIKARKGTGAGAVQPGCDCNTSDAVHFPECAMVKKAQANEVKAKKLDVRADAPRMSEDAATDLVRLIQSLAGARGIDEGEVRRIAADEAAKVSTNRSISITVGAAPEVKLDLAHRDLPLLIKLISVHGANGHRPNVYMHGPAGSGKSTAARQASEVLKLPYGYISLNPQTPDSRLLGYMHAGGEYVKSEFFQRYTEGGVFCIDEIDNAAASLVTTLNGLLENGHGAFPHGVFTRHKDFVCVCTANTIGRGGDINYPERRALDGAFLERFLFLAWEYDTDLTKAIVTGILGGAAAEFMAWVNGEARDMQTRYPTLIVSPRAHIQGAVLEKMGLSRNQIRPMVIARGLK
jgi:hypothetical protein